MHIVRRSSWVNISAYTAGTVPKYISIFLMLLTDKWPAAWPKGGYQRHILHRADEEVPSDISYGYRYAYRLERRYIKIGCKYKHVPSTDKVSLLRNVLANLPL